jgi:hypothetical protein
MANWDDAPLICYGTDGPAFVRLCPSCGRFMKWPQTIAWKENSGICEFQKIECTRCGPVEPDHIGWTGDFT